MAKVRRVPRRRTSPRRRLRPHLQCRGPYTHSSVCRGSALPCLGVTLAGKGVRSIRERGWLYGDTSRKGAKELMVEDISREELKAKMERGGNLCSWRRCQRSPTGAATCRARSTCRRGKPAKRRSWSPTRKLRSSSTVRAHRELSPRRPPVSWWPWATLTCGTTREASKTG